MFVTLTFPTSSWNLLNCAKRLTNVRYSMYGPKYIEPVFNVEEQKKIREQGDLQSYLFRPIKAPLSNQTCSVFFDPEVSKFTNIIMRDGRKTLARSLVEKTFEQIKRNQIELYNKATTDEERNSIILDPLIIFREAVKNTTPIMKLTKIKRGGSTYHIPYPITDNEKRFRAMKWLIEAGTEKPTGTPFPKKMAIEFVDAAKNKGNAVKRKIELHRQCEANRAYAHYRWS